VYPSDYDCGKDDPKIEQAKRDIARFRRLVKTGSLKLVERNSDKFERNEDIERAEREEKMIVI
jgi:hypothetical protein